MTYSRIIGTGSYLPEKVLTNKDLEKLVETSDKWIQERTTGKYADIKTIHRKLPKLCLYRDSNSTTGFRQSQKNSHQGLKLSRSAWFWLATIPGRSNIRQITCQRE